jgi:3-oxoacyl-[acyl-carrier protein] reductase
MDLGLEGRCALVTGASKGLGRACAAALAHEGARVFIVARGEVELQRTAEDIGAAGHQTADLSEATGCERAVEAAIELLGGLDILVANAGGPPPGTFQSTDLEGWDRGYQLTLMSTVRLIKLSLPHLLSSDQGRIVNITSISVRQPIPNILLSNAFRAAVTAAAKTLALEVAGSGLTVNNLAPGTIETDRVRQLYKDLAAKAREHPMGRIGQPDEFGATCAFLCSKWAGYITGQTLGIDGGELKGIY